MSVQVRQTCSESDVATISTVSGPRIRHCCHRSDKSGLQGEFGRTSTNAVLSAKHDEQALLPSPRNSVEGHLALLESTSCNI